MTEGIMFIVFLSPYLGKKDFNQNLNCMCFLFAPTKNPVAFEVKTHHPNLLQ